MPSGLRSLLRISAGLILLMLGIIGLFIPILQGVLLILVAVPIISPEHGKKMVGKVKEWLEKWKMSKAKDQKHM